MQNTVEKENVSQHKNKVHGILAHSYSVYFLFFLIGVFLDLIFKFRLFNSSLMILIGVILMVLASFLILWAQRTSRNLRKENLKKDNFLKGPYVFTRSPTHWGLFFLMLGFGFMANAVFIVITTVISFIMTKVIYLRKEEIILEKKYGAPYLEYKKAVRL